MIHVVLEFSEVDDDGNLTSGREYVDLICDEAELDQRIEEEIKTYEAPDRYITQGNIKFALPQLSYTGYQTMER